MKRLNFTFATAIILAFATSLSAQQGTVKDSDGASYQTIKIGNQVWMAENLNSKSISCEGNTLASQTNGSESGTGAAFADGQPHFAFYQNREELAFGAIYNYSTIKQCDICPTGYAVPTKADWETLAASLGGVEKAGGALKRGGKSGFNADMMGRINQSGSVLEGKVGSWWAVTEDRSAIYTIELAADGTLTLMEEGNEKLGNYVRCIKR